MRKRLEEQQANAAELEKKRAQLAATAKLNGYLAQFDEALFKGDKASARRAAEAAARDPVTQPSLP